VSRDKGSIKPSLGRITAFQSCSVIREDQIHRDCHNRMQLSVRNISINTNSVRNMVIDTMSVKNKFATRAVKLLKRLLSKGSIGKKPELVDDNNNIASDNTANEYLEARLMELIASSPSSLKTPMVMKVVPACPDTICNIYGLSVQTNFQTAEAQVA